MPLRAWHRCREITLESMLEFVRVARNIWTLGTGKDADRITTTIHDGFVKSWHCCLIGFSI